jgi:hypothetical protein
LKKNFSLIESNLKLWEEFKLKNSKFKQENIRQKKNNGNKEKILDLKSEKDKKFIELEKSLKGNLIELSRYNDGSRIIQTLIKYSSKENLFAIYKEIEENSLKLMKNIYSHKMMTNLITHADKKNEKSIINNIINKIRGHVSELVVDRNAINVLDKLYEVSNKEQRIIIYQDFFKKTIYEKEKFETLTDFFVQYPEKKNIIMKKLSDIIKKLIEKQLFIFEISQKLIYEYLINENDKNEITEIISDLHNVLSSIIHTKYGCLISLFCINNSERKEKKKILKSLKGFIIYLYKGLITKISQDSFGYLIICNIFKSYDDTKLVYDIVIKEILNDFSEIIKNSYSTKVLLFLFSTKPSSFIPNHHLNYLKNNEVNTTKKTFQTIQLELVKHFNNFFEEEENIITFLNNKQLTELYFEYLNNFQNKPKYDIIINKLIKEKKISNFFGRFICKIILDLKDQTFIQKLTSKLDYAALYQKEPFIVCALCKCDNRKYLPKIKESLSKITINSKLLKNIFSD